MVEQIYFEGAIPTTSLFMIEEMVGDKLDGYIYKIEAISATESKVPIEEMPYKWLTRKVYTTPLLILNYDHKSCFDGVFSIPLVVELARRYDIGDMWIQKLCLYIENKDYGKNVYEFRNKEITKGSEAEKVVFNRYSKWLKNRRFNGWIRNIPRRHLPLVSAFPLREPKLTIDEYHLHSQRFIAWLNRETYGIVLKKSVKRTTTDQLIDLNIQEVS